MIPTLVERCTDFVLVVTCEITSTLDFNFLAQRPSGWIARERPRVVANTEDIVTLFASRSQQLTYFNKVSALIFKLHLEHRVVHGKGMSG